MKKRSSLIIVLGKIYLSGIELNSGQCYSSLTCFQHASHGLCIYAINIMCVYVECLLKRKSSHPIYNNDMVASAAIFLFVLRCGGIFITFCLGMFYCSYIYLLLRLWLSWRNMNVYHLCLRAFLHEYKLFFTTGIFLNLFKICAIFWYQTDDFFKKNSFCNQWSFTKLLPQAIVNFIQQLRESIDAWCKNRYQQQRQPASSRVEWSARKLNFLAFIHSHKRESDHKIATQWMATKFSSLYALFNNVIFLLAESIFRYIIIMWGDEVHSRENAKI